MPDELLRLEAVVVTVTLFAVWLTYFSAELWGRDDESQWWPGELAAVSALPVEPLALDARPMYYRWPGGPRQRFALPAAGTRLALSAGWREMTGEIPVAQMGQPVPDEWAAPVLQVGGAR